MRLVFVKGQSFYWNIMRAWWENKRQIQTVWYLLFKVPNSRGLWGALVRFPSRNGFPSFNQIKLLSSSGPHQLAFYLTNILTFYLASFLAFYLTNILKSYLTFIRTFFLAFYSIWHFMLWHSIWPLLWHVSDILFGSLSGILSDMYSDILSGFLSDIYDHFQSGILAFLLTFYLACVLAFNLSGVLFNIHSDQYYFWHSISHLFWRSFWHLLWHSIWHSFWYVAGVRACPARSGACPRVRIHVPRGGKDLHLCENLEILTWQVGNHPLSKSKMIYTWNIPIRSPFPQWPFQYLNFRYCTIYIYIYMVPPPGTYLSLIYTFIL